MAVRPSHISYYPTAQPLTRGIRILLRHLSTISAARVFLESSTAVSTKGHLRCKVLRLHQLLLRRLALRLAPGQSSLLPPSSRPHKPWLHKVETFTVSAASPTT